MAMFPFLIMTPEAFNFFKGLIFGNQGNGDVSRRGARSSDNTTSESIAPSENIEPNRPTLDELAQRTNPKSVQQSPASSKESAATAVMEAPVSKET